MAEILDWCEAFGTREMLCALLNRKPAWYGRVASLQRFLNYTLVPPKNEWAEKLFAFHALMKWYRKESF